VKTSVDVSFFTSDDMPIVSIVPNELCHIVRLGRDITLFVSVEQLAYLAHRFESAVLDATMEKSNDHATV
jgi:hypothetical protein